MICLPEAGIGVAEAVDVEDFVPHPGIAVGIFFDRGAAGEVADVFEVLDSRGVGAELGEVEFGEVGEEVGVEDDPWGVAAEEFGVAGEVCVFDDGGAKAGH